MSVTLVLTACSGSRSNRSFSFRSATSVGTTITVANRFPVGPVTGTLIDGGGYSLAADSGQLVVINFWATWCPPCRIETPQFDVLYRQSHSEGVDFVGVDTKETSRAAVRSFIADNQISYPVIWDEAGRTAIELGRVPSGDLPFTVVIDRHQRVAAVYLHALTPADLRPVLTSLLAES
jgi:thiol-disulfide isomerase/thioredoxin